MVSTWRPVRQSSMAAAVSCSDPPPWGAGHLTLLRHETALLRGRQSAKERQSVTGDQVLGVTLGMFLLALLLLLEVQGESAQSQPGETDRHGESGHAGCSLQGRVLLQSLHEIRLRFRPPVASGTMLPIRGWEAESPPVTTAAAWSVPVVTTVFRSSLCSEVI